MKDLDLGNRVDRRERSASLEEQENFFREKNVEEEIANR